MQKPHGEQEHSMFKEVGKVQRGLRGEGRSDLEAADKVSSVQMFEWACLCRRECLEIPWERNM